MSASSYARNSDTDAIRRSNFRNAKRMANSLGRPVESSDGQTAKPDFDEVSFIMAFEEGEVSEEELIEGFQHLIDSGAAWKLQGSYGRTAAALIEAGHCHA